MKTNPTDSLLGFLCIVWFLVTGIAAARFILTPQVKPVYNLEVHQTDRSHTTCFLWVQCTKGD